MFNRTMIAAAAAVSLLFAAPVASAQEIIESYTAFIGPDDLYNSRGQRLRDAAAIIRQDRANVHVYGIIDPEDEFDSFFDDRENRATLERWVRFGRMDPGVERLILRGGAVVHVQIYGYGDVGEYVNIIVF